MKVLKDSGSPYDAELTFSRRKGARDVVVETEVSDDLHTWYSGQLYVEEVSVSDDGNGITETVTYRAKNPVNNPDRLFMKVRAIK